jgi:hypothetical protein
VSESSGASFSWISTKASAPPSARLTTAKPIADIAGFCQGSMRIQPNKPRAPALRACTSSEATITRNTVTVGTLMNSDKSDPSTRTVSARPGSRNM